MLNKLVKYEFKSTGRILPLIYLAVLVLSVCVGFSFRNSMLIEDMPWGNMVFFSIYAILVVVLIVLTIVVIIERFYKSMISQEGYLMHTLPVKPWQHIVSKLCMAVIWTAIAVLVLIASLFIIGGVSGLLSEMLADADFVLMLNEMEFVFGEGFLELVIITSIVQGIRLILQAYASMAIGGSSVKNKVAYSILAFVVITIVVSVIASLVSMLFMTGLFAGSGEFAEFMLSETTDMTGLSQGFEQMFGSMFVMQLVMDGIFIVVFFALTNHFLSKRLNLA